MASKGLIAGTVKPAAKPATKRAAKPAAVTPPAPKTVLAKAKAKPAPVALKTPVAVKPPVAVKAAPVAAKTPVAPKPAVVAKAAPAAKPAPAVPVPAAAAAAPAPPVAAKPAPVVTPEAIKPSKPVVAAAAAIIKKDVITMEATIKSATDKVQAQAKTLFADVNDRTKTAMEKGSKMIEDMNEFSKGNVEAMVESSKIAAKGVETLGQEAAEYSRKQFESATAVLKSMSSVKSPTDFFKLQSDYIRSAFDSMVAETSKNTESMLKLAGEVAQPISSRVAVAAEKIKIAA